MFYEMRQGSWQGLTMVLRSAYTKREEKNKAQEIGQYDHWHLSSFFSLLKIKTKTIGIHWKEKLPHTVHS